jgi:o-succinylbenzoate---CoA ligase
MERSRLAALLGAGPGAVADSLIIDADPRSFMALAARAIRGENNVFLGSPGWAQAERQEVGRSVANEVSGERGWLMIPTGGSSGAIKFARHDGETVAAAVDGFRAHFAIDRVNSVCVLPLHHVGGFMSWMRSALSGGSFQAIPWKEVEKGTLPDSLPEAACLSLVPTQLQRLLGSERAVSWLRGFKVISVGGGPAWDGLIESSAAHGLALSPGYGATETAAMVAAIRPVEFLNGMRGCGSALPHAKIEIDNGIVQVSGDSIFRGYYPELAGGRTWTSHDLGSWAANGSLHIEGRRDDVLTTGGEKVSPIEVEEALRSSGQFEDVAVIGLPHPDWGHAVVACYPGGMRSADASRIESALSRLASFKRPKWYAAISPWPRNPQGKIDRPALARLALVSPRLSSPTAF